MKTNKLPFIITFRKGYIEVCTCRCENWKSQDTCSFFQTLVDVIEGKGWEIDKSQSEPLSVTLIQTLQVASRISLSFVKRYFVVIVLVLCSCRFTVWPWGCLPYLKKKWRKSLLILKLVKNSMKNFEEARDSGDSKSVTVSVRLTKVPGKLVIVSFLCNFVKFQVVIMSLILLCKRFFFGGWGGGNAGN